MHVFISGHLDLTEAEFEEHYVKRLQRQKRLGASFVVGDARGADQMAQRWLAAQTDLLPSDVTVYHMFTSPRHNEGGFPTIGGFTSDDERDAAMTAASYRDILWVRPGRERSGTAKNHLRRVQARVGGAHVSVEVYESGAVEDIVSDWVRAVGPAMLRERDPKLVRALSFCSRHGVEALVADILDDPREDITEADRSLRFAAVFRSRGNTLFPPDLRAKAWAGLRRIFAGHLTDNLPTSRLGKLDDADNLVRQALLAAPHVGGLEWTIAMIADPSVSLGALSPLATGISYAVGVWNPKGSYAEDDAVLARLARALIARWRVIPTGDVSAELLAAMGHTVTMETVDEVAQVYAEVWSDESRLTWSHAEPRVAEAAASSMAMRTIFRRLGEPGLDRFKIAFAGVQTEARFWKGANPRFLAGS